MVELDKLLELVKMVDSGFLDSLREKVEVKHQLNSQQLIAFQNASPIVK
jgi:hypothetical protein